MQKESILVQSSKELEDEPSWIIFLRKHTRFQHQRGKLYRVLACEHQRDKI